MALVFDRDPFGWMHPFLRRRHLFTNWTHDWSGFDPLPLESFRRPNRWFGFDPTGSLQLMNSLEQGRSYNDRFEVKLDVQQFTAEELDVKMVDNYLIVEGTHKEKQDEHGYIYRSFKRKQLIPSNVKPETITCDLSSDGVLKISAPTVPEGQSDSERVIPIMYTGQPALASTCRGGDLAICSV